MTTTATQYVCTPSGRDLQRANTVADTKLQLQRCQCRRACRSEHTSAFALRQGTTSRRDLHGRHLSNPQYVATGSITRHPRTDENTRNERTPQSHRTPTTSASTLFCHLSGPTDHGIGTAGSDPVRCRSWCSPTGPGTGRRIPRRWHARLPRRASPCGEQYAARGRHA